MEDQRELLAAEKLKASRSQLQMDVAMLKGMVQECRHLMAQLSNDWDALKADILEETRSLEEFVQLQKLHEVSMNK